MFGRQSLHQFVELDGNNIIIIYFLLLNMGVLKILTSDKEGGISGKLLDLPQKSPSVPPKR
jgi:hypothetical protein